ncbi:S26 family signal peptidase [Streptomyces sp. S.PNR 29]|uniref:S26 family signal peptidase n=1 Tax=Streptomyces sp. S.PNR 29 TaxID=2973805 RepID=UPI0025AF39D6|nr:S26 family signal peptidase [Streptomyces sp. S.PNR 29]MDN0201091.1 S26 family signal peptidase [Streptomyces sp. S.PNR 29]
MRPASASREGARRCPGAPGGGARAEWAAACGLLASLTLAGAALHAALGRRLVVVTVRGASMEPLYHDGERVLVHRRPSLTPGQVVVVEKPAPDATRFPAPPPLAASSRVVTGRHWMIKRVVCLPGDPVPTTGFPALVGLTGRPVPPGRLVLAGDNATVSVDSRQLGFFPVNRLLGSVVCRLSRF